MKYIILFAISALFITSCSNKKENSVLETKFVLSEKMMKTTKTAISRVIPLQNQLNFFGEITTDNSKLIEVYPVVGGNVTNVYVELGDYVKKNQLLATIRSTEVASFEKDLEDAKNDLVVARNNYRVAQELFSGKINTESDIIASKGELDKAQSQLQRVKETFNIYNIKPGAIYEVRSPINGFIIQKNINQDMLLRNDNSNNIFDVAEINDVWAIANVNETDIDQVKLGIDASVTTLSYPDKIFHGQVDKIYNIIDPETQAMKIRIKLENKDFKLKPEMRATIRLSYNESQKMIAIPSSAIIFDKSKYFVMIYKANNDITTREVEVFRQIGDVTFISSGLKKNEKVITSNQLLIYDALND